MCKSLQPMSSVSSIERFSPRPCPTNSCSNAVPNFKYLLSISDSSSSPMTLAKSLASPTRAYEEKSWFATSWWSSLVYSSPMPSFMRRESDGSTFIGG